MSADQHPVAAHSVRLDRHDKELDHIVERVQQLVDDDHARTAEVAGMRAELARVATAVERIEAKVDAGFERMNGRVRKLEVEVAVLRWGFGLVAFAAGSLWAVVLPRLLGKG